MKFESFTQTGLPSHFTVVAPFAVSDDLAMFGYGIGMGGAGGAGVLQTSGKRDGHAVAAVVHDRQLVHADRDRHRQLLSDSMSFS